MLRSAFLAVAVAAAAAPAAAVTLPPEPCELAGYEDDDIELGGYELPPSHHHGFGDGDRDEREHRRPRDDERGDWHGGDWPHGDDCAPVSEPASLALLGAAAAALAVARRKR